MPFVKINVSSEVGKAVRDDVQRDVRRVLAAVLGIGEEQGNVDVYDAAPMVNHVDDILLNDDPCVDVLVFTGKNGESDPRLHDEINRVIVSHIKVDAQDIHFNFIEGEKKKNGEPAIPVTRIRGLKDM